MDLLTALLTCNLYGPDPMLVRAIAANAHANPHFVVDATADAPIDSAAAAEPRSDAEAVARAQEIAAHGGKPLLGLLQVPPAWLASFGRQLPDAFDPCVNVAIGSAMLSSFDYECAHARLARPRSASPDPARPPPAISSRRLCVLRSYADALGEPDLEQAVTLELNTPGSHQLLPDPADAPIFPAPPSRSWGPDCVLVPWLLTPAPSAPAPSSAPAR